MVFRHLPSWPVAHSMQSLRGSGYGRGWPRDVRGVEVFGSLGGAGGYRSPPPRLSRTPGSMLHASSASYAKRPTRQGMQRAADLTYRGSHFERFGPSYSGRRLPSAWAPCLASMKPRSIGLPHLGHMHSASLNSFATTARRSAIVRKNPDSAMRTAWLH